MRPLRLFTIAIISVFILFPCSAAGTESDEPEFQAVLSGICITEIPDPTKGTVMIGTRTIKTGDVLTAEQSKQMVFIPASSAEPTAQVCFLPIYSQGLAPQATVTLSIRGKADLPPNAEDMEIETYKNLPAEGLLTVSDPEEQEMIYTVRRAPKRGSLILREDGSYLYTPEKNKVGTDSFVYTATDPAGNISREATVIIHILKPEDSRLYTDTARLSCRFAAEWMRQTGIFSGEQVGGQLCFSPDESVSHGQFLAMLMDTLGFPVEHSIPASGTTCPEWLAPYIDAGIRAGILDSEAKFPWNHPVTGSEAGELIRLALGFSVPTALTGSGSPIDLPDELSIPEKDIPLTRANAAEVLYRISKYKERSPGLTRFFSQ